MPASQGSGKESRPARSGAHRLGEKGLGLRGSKEPKGLGAQGLKGVGSVGLQLQNRRSERGWVHEEHSEAKTQIEFPPPFSETSKP